MTSILVGYLISNPVYTYILNIYVIIYIYIRYNGKHFVLDEPDFSFWIWLNGITYFYLIQIILLTSDHLFEQI